MIGKCDACGLELNGDRDCINLSCPKDSPLNWLQFFGCPDAMDLDFTKAELNSLVLGKIVKDPADLFLTTIADLKLYAHSTDSRAKELLHSLDSAKTSTTLPRTLYSLGIPNVSEVKADKLWHKYTSLYDVASAPVTELVICGMDVVTSEYIVDFFERPEMLELLIRLEGAGVPMVYPAWQRAFVAQQAPSIRGSGPSQIRSKYFVFTGKLLSMTRAEAEAMVNRLGGNFQSSVNSMTDYLVTGSRVGAVKTDAARKQGVTVITEAEFQRMARTQ